MFVIWTHETFHSFWSLHVNVSRWHIFNLYGESWNRLWLGECICWLTADMNQFLTRTLHRSLDVEIYQSSWEQLTSSSATQNQWRLLYRRCQTLSLPGLHALIFEFHLNLPWNVMGRYTQITTLSILPFMGLFKELGFCLNHGRGRVFHNPNLLSKFVNFVMMKHRIKNGHYTAHRAVVRSVSSY